MMIDNMKKMKDKMKRSAVLALSFALVWMFLLPMQAFAEDNGTETVVTTSETVSSETGTTQTETAASTGTAYLAPSLSTDASPAQPQAETEATEPTEEATQPTEPIHEPAPAAIQQHTVEAYKMSFFTPPSAPKEDTGTVEWNDGYTSAELTSMKKEKEAQIKQL